MQPDGKLKIKFSELGRPPAYEGATELVVGPGETRVLLLPAIATDKGDGTLRTVVVITTLAAKQGDQDGRSRDEEWHHWDYVIGRMPGGPITDGRTEGPRSSR